MKQERHATTLAEDLRRLRPAQPCTGSFYRTAGDHRQEPRRRRIGRADTGLCARLARGAPADGIRRLFQRRPTAAPTWADRRKRDGEAIVMSWQEGNRTSIHAHPQFAGYHFRRQVPARNLRARRRRHGTSGAERRGRSPVRVLRNREIGVFRQTHTRITCLSPHGAQPARLFGRRTARQGIRRSGTNKPRTSPPPSAPHPERPQPPHGNHGSRGNR